MTRIKSKGRDTFPNGQPIPEGTDYLRLVSQQEDECESRIDKVIPKLGKLAPRCVRELGSVLSLMDRLASCWWGCREGNHVFEYLIGRACNCARAGLRLTRFAFYDEALVLARSIGEIANLLALFTFDLPSCAAWLAADRKARLREFGPAAVRRKLEAVGKPVPIDQKRYELLCERATHVTPATKPQAHNMVGVPLSGGYQQDAGTLLALNEISWAMVFVGLAAVPLIKPKKKHARRISTCCSRLGRAIGGVTILDMDRMWMHMRKRAADRRTRGGRTARRARPD